MKKSELKKRILEALTPDEASKVDAKYKEIYAGMVGKNPLKMKKYDNPDKVAYGRAINLIQKESLKLAEKLGKDADLGDHIDDFTDSDAPQFKGKSKKKIRQMATAAFLNKEEQKLDEIDNLMEKEEKTSEDRLERIIKSVLKKEGGAAGLDPLKKAIKGEDTDKDFDIEKFIKKLDSVEKHRDGDYILKETGQEIATKNMDMYKDKNRLTEFVKAALMKETSTDKYDDNPALKGKQSDLPDGLQKAIIKKKSGDVDESFDSLAKKLDKQKGITKDEAGKIAGKIANIKRKGGGKGPTAKQKKRMAETILKELRGGNVKLSSQEQEIFNDITSSLNEGMFDNVLEKVKRYARKGLMTVALLSALAAPNLGFSQVQRQQLKDVAQTEMSTNEISRMNKIGIVTTALSNYKRGRDLDKLDDNLKQDLDGVKDGIKNADQLVNIFDFNTDALQAYVPLSF